jgi:hypothetical protein
VLVVGGTIPNDDIPELKQLGVAEVFTPGTPVQNVLDYIADVAVSALALGRNGWHPSHCRVTAPLRSSLLTTHP